MLTEKTELVGQQEGHPACKELGVGLLVFTIWLELARLVAPVVTTTFVILSSSKISNGDILVLVNPGPPVKMAVKMEREVLCSGLSALEELRNALYKSTTTNTFRFKDKNHWGLY